MTPRALAVLGLALATSGCIDSTPPLTIQGICGFPDDPVACKQPAGKCDTFLNGALFVYGTTTGFTGTNDLFVVAEVDNRAPDNSSTDLGRVNTLDAIIESARISYSNSAGLLISSVDVPALFTPVPAPGSATIFVTVMTSTTVAEITGGMGAGASADVVAHVKLAGHLLDGSSFETGTFDVPVNVRNAAFTPAGCTDPTQVRFFCPPNPGQTADSKCAAP